MPIVFTDGEVDNNIETMDMTYIESLNLNRHGYIFGKIHMKTESINNVNLGFMEGVWKL